MPPSTVLRKKRIVILGSRSVGKSALALRYLESRFVENYFPTIESSFKRKLSCNNTDYFCEIVDTAGHDEFSLVNASHTIGTHGYILVYSVTSRNSLEMVKILYERILDFSGVVHVPCVIVGCKSDLQQYRQVGQDEGRALATSNKAAWIETSAKEDINVAKVFELCLLEIEKSSSQSSNFTSSLPRPTKKNNRSCIIM